MKGWSEKEIGNKDLMAPCGLYCGTCGVYIATRDSNEKFRTLIIFLVQSLRRLNVYAACKMILLKNYFVFVIIVK